MVVIGDGFDLVPRVLRRTDRKLAEISGPRLLPFFLRNKVNFVIYNYEQPTPRSFCAFRLCSVVPTVFRLCSAARSI